MTLRAGTGIAAALAAAALAGCGDEPLSDGDERTVAEFQAALSFYCPHAGAPNRPAPPAIVRGAEAVIAIHEADPDATYKEGQEEETDMAHVMELAERQLRWCDPAVADRVEREL